MENKLLIKINIQYHLEKIFFCTLLTPKAKKPAEKAVTNCIIPIAVRKITGIIFSLNKTKAAKNKNNDLAPAEINKVKK